MCVARIEKMRGFWLEVLVLVLAVTTAKGGKGDRCW